MLVSAKAGARQGRQAGGCDCEVAKTHGLLPGGRGARTLFFLSAMQIKSVATSPRCQAVPRICGPTSASARLTAPVRGEINSATQKKCVEAEASRAMKTADPELMRAINRFHVMDAIRRFGPVSRVEISQFTELSATTVSAITAALLDDRLIIPLQVGAVARRRPRPAARHAQAQSGRRPCRRRQARARPDHGRGDQFLRRRPAHARAADPHRPPDRRR